MTTLSAASHRQKPMPIVSRNLKKRMISYSVTVLAPLGALRLILLYPPARQVKASHLAVEATCRCHQRV